MEIFFRMCFKNSAVKLQTIPLRSYRFQILNLESIHFPPFFPEREMKKKNTENENKEQAAIMEQRCCSRDGD